MALPSEIKEQFEKYVGVSFNELAERIDSGCNIREQFNWGNIQKDKENLEILSNW